MSVRDLLARQVPKRLLVDVPSSFDILGSREKAVAIVEIPRSLEKYKLKIASAIMKQHRNVASVLAKGTPRKGVYRIRDYRLLAGQKDTEVVHNENGCRFALDPQKVYFSQREGTERLRMASMVKNNQSVMVFFAGVGPFPIVISKRSGAARVVGIEINPEATEYFRKNVEMNKCRNVEVVCGSVDEAACDFRDFDHVLMPLPETSVEYLPWAFGCLKSGGIVHIYFFSTEENLGKMKSKIRAAARKAKRKIAFVSKSNVLPYGPGIWKMRLDVRAD